MEQYDNDWVKVVDDDDDDDDDDDSRSTGPSSPSS